MNGKVTCSHHDFFLISSFGALVKFLALLPNYVPGESVHSEILVAFLLLLFQPP